MKLWLSFLAVLLCASRLPGADSGSFDYKAFGALPIVYNGRIQPLDSLARNSLLQLREKQTANLEPWKGAFEKPRIIPATEWLATMFTNPELANEWPVIRIDHPDLKGLLGLPMEADPQKKTDGKNFSWNLISPKLEDLQREANRASKLEQQKRNPFEQAVMRLWSCVGIYMRLQNTLQPQNARDWQKELAEFTANAPAGVAAIRAQRAKESFDQAAIDKLVPDLQRFEVMAQLEPPLVIPPRLNAAASPDSPATWRRTVEALTDVAQGDPVPFALTAFAKMSTALRTDNPAAFTEAINDYRATLQEPFGPALKKASSEQFFNKLEPFYKTLCIYVAALLAVLFFWMAPARLPWLRSAAVWMIFAALVIHTTGLIFRMVLEGRPPVTNLYSSAIFIGWGACILGLVLERFWRNGIGLAVSSSIGFITLIIAHHLALSGDTMEMMRAVLDTNMWLATHVVVVTLGYSSTYVAGFLAIVYLIRGILTRSLDSDTARGLGKMVYGIVCFATLFSFVGTVLGGIWADQSWGRFWGWDPKENGALIIVLWNALILHAKWGGLVRERGLMLLAIGGNIVTSWSWFGVNMLGIGLHSYGFMESGFLWLMGFLASQLLLIALGSLPGRLWRSASALASSTAAHLAPPKKAPAV